LSKPTDLRAWTINDSSELYQVPAWGGDYFSDAPNGDLSTHPKGPSGPSFSLHELVEDLKRRGYELPFLLRISDILQHRIQGITGAFDLAIREYGYSGRYRPLFPIKVNQQRDVVEEMVGFGRSAGLGLEAGSKPELLVALALVEEPGDLIVCNGYKDTLYIEAALMAQKLGADCIMVVDRYQELELILRVSNAMGVRPKLGVRAKLASRGAGKWQESGGDKSKFGLTAGELIKVVRRLEECEMLDCLALLHFHIGSQITAIRAIKDALREATRIFVELHQLGARLQFLDVGGGLAVDYDGSQTNFHSSANYSLQEYANDVVFAVLNACDEKDIPHPDVLSESGRALSAHHSVLVFDVLSVAQTNVEVPPGVEDHDSEAVHGLMEIYRSLSAKNFLEAYHDALQLKEEAQSLFNLGYLDLEGRALAEHMFWVICSRIRHLIRDMDYVPDEFDGLERALADTYYCNFSVFQSAPDHWAVNQLFPVMPIHRLNERPERKGILADLTCDSDGKVDRFIDLRDVKSSLELHSVTPGQPYYLAMFLVGAYQDILGDLHNLFGDTNAIHVTSDAEYGYSIERVVEGDTISEVLGYVQYDVPELTRRIRALTEKAVRRGQIGMEEAAALRRRFHEGLAGYTYLSPDPVAEEPVGGPPAKAGAVSAAAAQDPARPVAADGAAGD